MEPGKETQCPNCAELWKRLDEANEEKAKAIQERAQVEKTQRSMYPWMIVWFICTLISLVINLIK